MRACLAGLAVALALVAAPAAEASRFVRYGIHDDAWLVSGPGTLDGRLNLLDRLGVDLVRYTIRWDDVEASPGEYDWAVADSVLTGLRARGMQALVTIVGAPTWANGGRGPNWAPRSGITTERFAFAAASRYGWVRDWLVWNEPNQRRWLRPTEPAVYVRRILNPAYRGIKAANARARVGGGASAPRGNVGGKSPVDWIRGMGRARARLDAYAHHPYPTDPRRQSPRSTACRHCSTLPLSALDRLVAEVRRSLGRKRIWLTEFAYQTNPPDRWLGVSPANQARYLSEAAQLAHASASVDMLVHFIVRDDIAPGGWQSGLFTTRGRAKPSYAAFRFPLAQTGRRGRSAVLWGQIRPRSGKQPYRLRVAGGRWLGGTRWTSSRGFFVVTVPLRPGQRVRVWSPRDRAYGAPVLVR